MPEVVGVSVGSVGESGTMTVARPAEAQEGDLLIVGAYTDADVTAPDESWELVEQGTHGAGHTGSAWSRRDDGSPGPWEFPLAATDWQDWVCLAVRGAATVNGSSSGSGTGAAITAPSVETTADGCLLIFMAFANNELAGITPPAGMDGWVEDEATYLAVADDVQAVAGETGSRTATDDNTRDWVAILLAISPEEDPVAPAARNVMASASDDLPEFGGRLIH